MKRMLNLWTIIIHRHSKYRLYEIFNIFINNQFLTNLQITERKEIDMALT